MNVFLKNFLVFIKFLLPLNALHGDIKKELCDQKLEKFLKVLPSNYSQLEHLCVTKCFTIVYSVTMVYSSSNQKPLNNNKLSTLFTFPYVLLSVVIIVDQSDCLVNYITFHRVKSAFRPFQKLFKVSYVMSFRIACLFNSRLSILNILSMGFKSGDLGGIVNNSALIALRACHAFAQLKTGQLS